MRLHLKLVQLPALMVFTRSRADIAIAFPLGYHDLLSEGVIRHAQ